MPVNPVSVAPMMEYTDRHFRYLLRLISRRSLLYTEMVTSAALLHGDIDRFLKFQGIEHPIAVQFGGSDPLELSEAAQIASDYDYDEINLNVGCPSNRVQKGRMGACLMAEPELVAACVEAMRSKVAIPISVKTRIGIDERDSYDFLASFIEQVAQAGCRKFVIHARKALLNTLSPKQNRQVPPLCYDRVFRIKADFPHLEIVLNGGINSLDQTAELLERVDGVMIGREAYKNPYSFAEVDHRFYGETRHEPGRMAVLQAYSKYLQEQIDHGFSLNKVLRHLFGLFHARKHSREWRRRLTELMRAPQFDADVMRCLASCECS
ncbi:MAG: tRNA dihydrouridine(20/20a) synthase DusA [Methylococcales bacterium]